MHEARPPGRLPRFVLVQPVHDAGAVPPDAARSRAGRRPRSAAARNAPAVPRPRRQSQLRPGFVFEGRYHADLITANARRIGKKDKTRHGGIKSAVPRKTVKRRNHLCADREDDLQFRAFLLFRIFHRCTCWFGSFNYRRIFFTALRSIIFASALRHNRLWKSQRNLG